MASEVDINSDLGEAFGAWTTADDDALLGLLSSANVACGFHGGDPRVMEQTVAKAKANGVAVGAHPGFPDLVGFGRRIIAATPDEVRTDTLYQIAALDGFCRAAGVRMQHVKAHGALFHYAVNNAEPARAFAAAVKSFNPELLILVQPGTELFKAGTAAGLGMVREQFIDRGYNADGTLVSRAKPGALITDPALAAARAVRMVQHGLVETVDGTEIAVEVDSLCIHSDTPGAVGILRVVRQALEAAGIAIRSPR